MLKLIAPTVAFAAFALPALAAQTPATQPETAAPNAPHVQQQLRQDLASAGYTDIRIMPGSFVVHATDKHGNPTEMIISPTSLTEVTAMNNTANAGSAKATNGAAAANADTAGSASQMPKTQPGK